MLPHVACLDVCCPGKQLIGLGWHTVGKFASIVGIVRRDNGTSYHLDGHLGTDTHLTYGTP